MPEQLVQAPTYKRFNQILSQVQNMPSKLMTIYTLFQAVLKSL